jgi:hypothetical protein
MIPQDGLIQFVPFLIVCQGRPTVMYLRALIPARVHIVSIKFAIIIEQQLPYKHDMVTKTCA